MIKSGSFYTDEFKRPTAMEKLTKLFFLQFIIFRHIWWQVALVFSYTLGVVLLNYFYPDIFYMPWDTSVIPVLGVVASLLLVFRTNTSYDR